MKKLILTLVLVILIFVSLSGLTGCNFVFLDRSEGTDVLDSTTYTMDDFKRDWPEAIKVRVSDLDEYDMVSSFDKESTIGEYIWITPVSTGRYMWVVPMHPID